MLDAAAIKSVDMAKGFPIIPAIAALAVALSLSACGKQEAVGDVPSGEELARQADEASAAIREEEAAQDGETAETGSQELSLTSYTNALRGYTIMVPESWTVDTEASDDNGHTVTAPENGGIITVGWTQNRDNAEMEAAIAAVQEADESMSSDQVSEDEYRATGTEGGNKVILRILRKPDGSMVRARISYPSSSAGQFDVIASQIIDSLALR